MTEGSILWTPSDDFKNNSNMRRYMDWLAQTKQLRFDSYDTLWKWSVDHIDDFWRTICEFFDVKFSVPYSAVLGKREMPGVEWFPGAMLNYVDQIFRFPASAKPAIVFQSETRGKNSEVRTQNPESAHLPFESLSWRELHERVTSVADALSAMGVKQGDRVAAFVPNMPEAVIAFLAGHGRDGRIRSLQTNRTQNSFRHRRLHLQQQTERPTRSRRRNDSRIASVDACGVDRLFTKWRVWRW
jgi:acetoacetyl-CoA synthetase